MASLTPLSRSAEATSAAMNEGLMNGFLTFVPTCGALFVAMKNPTFLKYTNNMSRTALATMPALFVFSLSSEARLNRKMHEIARESSHSAETVKWAERQWEQHPDTSRIDQAIHLTELYKRSIEESGVRVVPGDRLGIHHLTANYAADHPLQVLTALAVPSVAWIFYGRTGKEHLEFSVKLLHTRVFGQFTALTLLVSLMAFKDFMGRNGRFISEAEADRRVEEMKLLRESLLQQLNQEKERQNVFKRDIEAAHVQDKLDRINQRKMASVNLNEGVVHVIPTSH